MRSLLTLVFLSILMLPHGAEAGSSDNLSGWAWSSTIGWVSLNSTTGGGASHGVNVSASGAMSGYAWSPNVGWISFNSSNLGGCPSGTCSARFDKQTGAVSGWARAIAGTGSSIQTGNWGGWIQLSGSSYAVTASGCQWSGYAWGGGPSLDSGVIGWLSFRGSGYGVTGSGTACAGGTLNLTAEVITPTTASPGVATTYTSTVTNSGPAATGGSFSALFQRATDASGSNATDLGAVTISNLASGGTATASMNATLATGTWYLRACADKASGADTGLITESSEVDNCGPWTAIAVTGAMLPDLTPGVVSPSTAPEDSPVTLSSSVTNGGSAAAGAFPNIFQIENGAIISANTVPSLATGASSVLSTSHTFTSAGTYRVRSCADNNSSWVGSVSESNEGNNCGEYTSITVPACSGVGCTGYPGTLSCSVSNSNPLVGQTVTYTATPGGGATGPYIWTPSDSVTGLGTGATASRSFPNPGDYTMNVSSATGASASCTPRVSVGCGVAAASISASPTRVKKGTTATLTIPSLSGVDGTCTVTGPGVSRTFTAAGCSVPATSFQTSAITTLSTYTLTCDSETTAKVIVNVVPAFQEF